MDIYVGNLPYGTDEQTLRDTFSEYGKVQSAKVIIDHYTGRSKGFAFVTMEDSKEANDAITALDGKTIGSRVIKVNAARPREERSPRDFSRRKDYQNKH